MNSIELFHKNALLHPKKMAIADIKHGILSFQDVVDMCCKVQQAMRDKNIQTGDSVLVAITPSPMLYGVLCGLMGMGVRIIFIEPWLSLERINHVIETTTPKAFITSTLGKIWGMRSSQIRSIPHWITPKDIVTTESQLPYQIAELSPDHHAFIVFSSGTSGAPKGVVRTHQYMQNIFNTFIALEPQNFKGPDLIIFPNVALFHLATGRGSVIVPHKWSKSNLLKTFELCDKFRPDTISTGPAFLKTLMDQNLLYRLGFIDRIVVGGALTDCWLLEKIFKDLPMIRVMHIYGGSEAEPVALMDAREAVKLSREKGYFQTLCLGRPIPQIKYKFKNEILWVNGLNVSGEYIGHPDENKGVKERDESGALWHCMGDRVNENAGLFWIFGRESQNKEDFELEQKLYSIFKSSKMFLHRQNDNTLILFGEGIKKHELIIKKSFPEIQQIKETTIVRDKRHRSRIDRKRSLRT